MLRDIIFDIYDIKCGWTTFIRKQNTIYGAGHRIFHCRSINDHNCHTEEYPRECEPTIRTTSNHCCKTLRTISSIQLLGEGLCHA